MHIPSFRAIVLVNDLPSCAKGTQFTKSLCAKYWCNKITNGPTHIKQYVFTNEEIISLIPRLDDVTTRDELLYKCNNAFFVSEYIYDIAMKKFPNNNDISDFIRIGKELNIL